VKFRRIAVLFLALALVAAACGDDDDDESTATTTTEGASSEECTLDEPLKIVGLAETTGEGSQAVPYYANGWQLAVDEINEAGGICGQDVSFERIPISPLDNAAAKNQLLSAFDKKPAFLMGMPNSATVVALAPDVARSGIPFIYFSSPPNAYLGATASVGSDNAFLIRPRTVGGASAQVEYLVKTLGKKKIGLLCVNQTFGQQGCDAAKPAIEAAGAEVVARESHEVTDTNLTSKVLAFKNKGVDGIVAYTFPNTGVVFFNQLADNGVNVPVMTGAIAGLAIASGNIKPDAIKNLYGFDDCAPAVEERASDFAEAYKAKFGGKAPTYSAAQAYDSLFIIKQAVEEAGSADHAAIVAAMKKVSYEGACTDYEADPGNGLAQSAVIESFGADGTPKVEKSVNLPPTEGK
jgi:branched-chain amino acid transport system substrate-binding protein